MLALLLCLAALAETPIHTITTLVVTTAGWKYVEVIPVTSGDQSGFTSAWSMRADAACTSTSFVPFLVDKTALSGSGTPTGNPPAEYRIAEKTAQVVVPSALEPTFATAFTEGQPYRNGLGLWLNITGGTTCTYTLSTWGYR
jgi:hypothetical protein